MKYFNKRSLLYTLITIIVLVLVSGSFYKLALQGKVVLHNGLSLEQTNDHLVRIAQSMRRNGKTIAVLYGVYMPSQLQSMLKENLFDNSATTKLVSSSGDIVAAPQKKSSIYTVEQFFNEAGTHISDTEHARYFGSLHNDRQGFATYKHKGQEYLNSLTPMDMGNFCTTDHSRWYLSLAVPYELVASRARVKILQTTGFSLALLAIIGALSFAFYRSNQQKPYLRYRARSLFWFAP